MIARIYNKGLSILNAAIGRLHMFFEHKNIVKPIAHSFYQKKENAVMVSHKLPVNIREPDKKLFDHYTNYSSCKEEVFELHRVNINEQGIVFKGPNNFAEAFPHPVFRAQYGWLYILGQYVFSKRIKGLPSKNYVLIYDFWARGNYYHWLVDALPRLMLLKDEFKLDNYSLILPRDCPKFMKATLSYFEISNITYLKKNEYLSAPNLMVPYYLAGSGRIHPAKVLEIRDRLVKNVSGYAQKERIYVSRSKQKARRVHNEQDVLALMKEFNFETVFFEDLSFREQMELVRNTKVMVSSHGANLTNLMFMEPGTKVLELVRSDRPNFCYWALASVCSLKYYYQLCSIARYDHLQVDIDLLKRNLQSMLHG
jgi:capsular polysaccharide biosynthesis protein